MQAFLVAVAQAGIRKVIAILHYTGGDAIKLNAMTLSLSTWGAQQADQLLRQVAEGNLDSISLPSLGIYELPPSFRFIKQDTIVRCTLRKNMMVDVPKELVSLPNLKSLNMDQNLLTSASLKNLFLLTSLTNLSLRSNQIVDLPPQISALSALEALDLSENRLVSLPTELLRLNSLSTLLLHGNAHLRSLSVPLAKLRTRPGMDAPLSFPADIGKYTAPEVLQYIAELSRLQLPIDLRSHHAGEDSGAKCSVCFKSEGKRTHCRVCGNWCCTNCHKLVTVHQLQVAEAVPVCQRCINQMMEKNMPVLIRTEADVELFKQLKKVKADMKALQSTERTLQALLKLYENSLASAFQVELANTQQQLLLTRRAQEALGVKFKKLAVLITEKVSASRATARGATAIDLKERPVSPRPKPSATQSKSPSPRDEKEKESPTKAATAAVGAAPSAAAGGAVGSPRVGGWVKVDPDSRPKLKSAVTADTPMDKPVLNPVGGARVATPNPRTASPIPMGSQRAAPTNQISPRSASPLPTTSPSQRVGLGTNRAVSPIPSGANRPPAVTASGSFALPPPIDMAPPPAPPPARDTAALARATASMMGDDKRSTSDPVSPLDENTHTGRDSTSSLSLSGMLADILLRKAAMPSGYSNRTPLADSHVTLDRATAADFGNPVYRSSFALARETAARLPAAEALPEPVALPGDALPLLRQARARFKFKAEKESEMSLKAGDIVIVTDASDSDWWFGFANGASGFFPASYVALLE